MAHLVKIGNSQGIRIPKPLVEQAHLEGKELKLQLVSDGLLITPEKEARAGWKEAIEEVITAQGQEAVDSEWLDIPLVSDEELEW
ncbi:MAG TPA: AbrB/MazE/SpoVT family DNA-binding domain-containing protein [Gammaproteobacteria bacterium]|nr:AbrB/MazE/SpoVT family DNA-binding domain-containing protein [Gammaproteobacteria bacterium]